MTSEELKAAAEVMRRAAEGEAVENRRRHYMDDIWNPSSPEPRWNWADYEYRIAPPKPREWWGIAVASSPCGLILGEYATCAEAEEARRDMECMVVHITEVLP